MQAKLLRNRDKYSVFYLKNNLFQLQILNLKAKKGL